jgi:hypothetical protein
MNTERFKKVTNPVLREFLLWCKERYDENPYMCHSSSPTTDCQVDWWIERYEAAVEAAPTCEHAESSRYPGRYKCGDRLTIGEAEAAREVSCREAVEA